METAFGKWLKCVMCSQKCPSLEFLDPDGILQAGTRTQKRSSEHKKTHKKQNQWSGSGMAGLCAFVSKCLSERVAYLDVWVHNLLDLLPKINQKKGTWHLDLGGWLAWKACHYSTRYSCHLSLSFPQQPSPRPRNSLSGAIVKSSRSKELLLILYSLLHLVSSGCWLNPLLGRLAVMPNMSIGMTCIVEAPRTRPSVSPICYLKSS